MTGRPMLSVVVPTCGRPASMRRLLTALARQESAPPFEIVVVADGVAPDAVGIDAGARWPFVLRVVHQAALGAAAARNRGVDEARASLLLFLDDDVEPSPATVRAHVGFHARHQGAVGAGDLTPSPEAGGFIGAALAGWWERMCDGLQDPRHRFTFRDLLTGHCSMPRPVFEQVGRFDLSLMCHEDFEFGYRAIAAGTPFGYVTGADALHHDATRLPGILARKFAEGRADVQLVARHPRLLRELPLGRGLAEGRFATRAFEAALTPGTGSELFHRSLLTALRVFEAMSMRDKWRDALERAMDLA
jgi:GT2 family glycosyltransferase